jgi:hypothetical protein
MPIELILVIVLFVVFFCAVALCAVIALVQPAPDFQEPFDWTPIRRGLTEVLEILDGDDRLP